MASAHPLSDLLDGIKESAKFQSPSEELKALRTENRQLRELVVPLSAIVIRHAVGPK